MKVLSNDPSKVWNSVDVEAVYSDQGGRDMSRRTLVEVVQHFGDKMLPLHSPGMATLLVFRNHVAKNLRIMDDENSFECVTSGYAIVVHSRPKTPKNTSFFGGHPAPRGRTAPIF